MSNFSIRLGWLQKWAVYIVSLVLLLTGILWLWFHYFVVIEGEYGPQVHPLENTFLVIHGTTGLLFLVLYGSMLPVHVLQAWRLRKNRISGTIFFAIIFILSLTSVGLYYLGGEYSREVTSLVHWVVGLSFPVIMCLHVWYGRYRTRFGGRIRQRNGNNKYLK